MTDRQDEYLVLAYAKLGEAKKTIHNKTILFVEFIKILLLLTLILIFIMISNHTCTYMQYILLFSFLISETIQFLKEQNKGGMRHHG